MKPIEENNKKEREEIRDGVEKFETDRLRENGP